MEVLDRLDADRIVALRERDEFFWLDLLAPDPATLDALGVLLDLPPFAVEDDKEFRQRPKIDDFGDRVLLVFYGAHHDELVEVHLHLTGSYVVTVHRAPCAGLERARAAVAGGEARSELDIVFRILDALADSIAAKLDGVAEHVDELEELAFGHPDDEVRREIARLRADLFGLQQIVRPQRDMLGSDGDLLEKLPGLEGYAARHPFREVHDVLVQASNRVEYLRELLAEALGIYLSSTSNRLNRLGTRLTILGTIFLPLSFVTGFFGQNFGWLVDRIDTRAAFLIWTIGPTLAVVVTAAVLGLLTTRRR